MSDPFSEPRPPARRPWYHWRRLGLNFLTISILVHALFGVGATYLIVQRIQSRPKPVFTGQPTGPSAAARSIEHKVQMQKKQATMSAPAITKRITTTSNSNVALPAMPAMPRMDSAVTPLAMAGMGGSGMGLSMGAGGASGGGPSGGGGLNLFGLRTGATGKGMVGAFYDLKQNMNGQPNEMGASLDAEMALGSPANVAYDRAISQFVKGNMVESMLNRFFKGPAPLYASRIYIPTMPADNGPKAFNLEDKVKPKRWIVVYRGNVVPPVDGSYRFAGWCDDVMIVRFNNRLALDGSLCNPTGLRPKTIYHYQKCPASIYVGDPVPVVGGKTYPMEVIIGERPGGVFNAFLLLEKVGENYEKSPMGSPVLPVLKFAAQAPPPAEGDEPEYAADTLWSVWPTSAAASILP